MENQIIPATLEELNKAIEKDVINDFNGERKEWKNKIIDEQDDEVWEYIIQGNSKD